jgi:DNA-binding HxlR family transcriptional regulator
MGWNGISDSLCPIARSLSVIGDRWTLLILRELLLEVRRFGDIQAQTGMSSNLLATRLQRMERDGIIERRLYQDKPKRYEYHATDKGHEFDEVILLLRSWGLRHGGYAKGAEKASKLVFRETGEEIGADWRLPSDGPRVTFDDIDASINDGWAAERSANQIAFEEGRARKRKPA